jgi:uncharacterized membrane protein
MNVKYDIAQLSFGIISMLILGLGFISKDTNSTVVIIGLLAIIALIIFDVYTPQIAHLSAENPKVKTMRRLNRASMGLIAACFSLLNFMPEIKTPTGKTGEMVNIAIVAVVMVVIGNTAPKIPFNRYMGLRLPWTVRDEATWKIAHKILGYVTFPLVITMIFGSIFGNYLFFIKYCIIAWIAIPGLYSCWFYYMRLGGKL